MLRQYDVSLQVTHVSVGKKMLSHHEDQIANSGSTEVD